jgi:hydroxymethylglutaryl-CoA lyase
MTRLYFNEVALRDGFQIEPNFIPTDTKVALVDALSDCGYAKIEVTSFTSPKAIPMLRDADEVMGRIRRAHRAGA